MAPFRGRNTMIVAVVVCAILLLIYHCHGYQHTQSIDLFHIKCNPRRTQSNDTNTKLRQENGAYVKGSKVADTEWILSQLSPFLKVYETRPKTPNGGGSKLMHQFALWCFVKLFQPKNIIESGIYLGFGTWILRQAAPEARLILLDPRHHVKYKDQNKDTLYLTQNNFTDFGSVKWASVLDDVENTLVFIDDHIYPILRLQQALKAGFKNIVFDDNYFWDGDVFSVRQFISIYLGHANKNKFTYTDKVHKSKKFDGEKSLKEANTFLDEHVKTYWEFPMLWRCLTCNTNSDNYNSLFPATNGTAILREYGLKRLPSAKELKKQYYNIAYIRLE